MFNKIFSARVRASDLVEGLHQALYQRAATPQEMQALLEKIDGGAGVASVVERLVSAEAFALRSERFTRGRTPFRTHVEIVEAVYVAVLDRAPDAAGRRDYLRHLDGGGELALLLRSVLESAEFRDRSATRQRSSDLAHYGQGAITILQTCDASRYVPLLECGRQLNQRYAMLHGFAYSTFVGMKRGHFPWHACFNRLFMLEELVRGGYRGWAFYVDADAYIYDQRFDLRAYVHRHADKCLIAAMGGDTGQRWDINDGVFLINLGHPDAREIVHRWHAHFMGTADADLKAASEWEDVPSDQPRLHEILRTESRLMQHLFVEERSFFNDYEARFVRQVLRGHGLSIERRLETMRRDVEAVLCSGS